MEKSNIIIIKKSKQTASRLFYFSKLQNPWNEWLAFFDDFTPFFAHWSWKHILLFSPQTKSGVVEVSLFFSFSTGWIFFRSKLLGRSFSHPHSLLQVWQP